MWGLAAWPIETTPRHPDLCEARAFVFLRDGMSYRAVDVRGMPDATDQVYPQHICRVWRAKQAEASHDQRRSEQVMDRLTR